MTTRGHVNPKDYFSTLVKVDKNDHSISIKIHEFTITDNCRLDDATLTVVDNGTLNGCAKADPAQLDDQRLSAEMQ
ncbi:MAG: hypothetical protein IPF93_25355 [Saprospiraceae bacterium]|nr:hypothetical protein [Saprospiraceae bacterium]